MTRKELESKLMEIYGLAANLDSLLDEGLIRQKDGTPFPYVEDQDNYQQVVTYLSKAGNSVSFFKKDEDNIQRKVGVFRTLNNSDIVEFDDCQGPTKDNEYGHGEMKDLGDVEISEELISFAKSLEKVLREQADLNIEMQNDRPRLKGYYENDGKLIERDMFKTFDYMTNNGKMSVSSYSNEKSSSVLDNVQNEILQNNFEVSNFLRLAEVNKDGISQSQRHQMYEMLALAKEGRLMVTKPGESFDDAHPLVFMDGNLSMLPSSKDASPEDLSYAGYSLVSKAHPVENKEKDQVYTDRLKNVHGKVYTQHLAGTIEGFEKVLAMTVIESIKLNKDRETYIQEILEAPRITKSDPQESFDRIRDDTNEMGGEIPSTKLKKFSQKEMEAREALSLKAVEKIVGSHYDTNVIYEKINEAASNKVFSDMDTYDTLRLDRDILTIVMDLNVGESAQQSNLDMVNMLCGGGLDPKDPNTKDMRQRLFATVINDRFSAIANQKFDQMINLPDEELVNRWDEVYPAFYKLAVSRACIYNLRTHFGDNPYLDQELFDRVNDLEEKYMSHHMLNQIRIRSIANPYYASTDVDAINTAINMQDSLTISMNLSDDISDPNLNRLYSNSNIIITNKAKIFGEDIEYSVSHKPNTPKEKENKQVSFFDENGKTLSSLNVFDYAKSGKPFFAMEMSTPSSLSAYVLDKKTGQAKPRQDLLMKKDSKMRTLLGSIKQSMDTHINDRFNKAQKSIEENILNAKADLDKAFEDPTNPDFAAKRDKAVVDLVTNFTIKRMMDNPDLDAKSKISFVEKDTFENYRNTLQNSEIVKRTILGLSEKPDAVKGMNSEDIYKYMLKCQQELGKEALDAKAKAKDEAYKNKVEGFENTRKVVQHLTSREFFTTKTWDDLIELKAKTPLKSMTLDRNSLQTLTMGMMLSQGYSVEDVFDIKYQKEREQISDIAAKIVEAGDYKVIRENLLKGFNVMNDYVSKHLNAIDPINYSNLLKLENATLIAACQTLKDFSQEFDNCQHHLPNAEKLNTEKSASILDRGEKLASVSGHILTNIVIPKTDSSDMVQNCLTSYIQSAVNAERIQSLRALPGNQGKPLEEIYSLDECGKAYGYYAVVVDSIRSSKINLENPNVRRAILTTIQDDSLKNYLHIKVGVDKDGGPKIEMDLKNAVKLSMNRKQAQMPYDKPEKKQEEHQKNNDQIIGM